jgi:hypothetical protein
MRRTARQDILRRRGVLELQQIVVRVFIELRELGEAEVTARGAALRVFTLHEPTLSRRRAGAIVAEWTDQAPRPSLTNTFHAMK